MIEISRGRAEEFDEIVDFLDYVFSKHNRPHDFASMYPNLYRRTDESMGNFINLREDGKIKASILCYPRTLCIGDKKLKVSGIGSVACHPRERGRGFMSTLLKYNNEEMAKQGVALSNLGGRRSRYNHFGYEIGASGYSTTLDIDDMRDSGFLSNEADFSFCEFSIDDRELVSALHMVYNSKPMHYDYDYDDFFLRLIIPTSNAYPLAVFDSDGKPIGYAAVKKDGDERLLVRELCIEDDRQMSDVLFALAFQFEMDVNFEYGDYQVPFISRALDFCSDPQLSGHGMWKVLDWKPVIEALLSFKASYMPLEKGRLVIGIGDNNKYAVEYDGKTVFVSDSDDVPDFSFDELKAVRALTGVASAAMFGEISDPDTFKTVRSWFPLPLHWLSTERV